MINHIGIAYTSDFTIAQQSPELNSMLEPEKQTAWCGSS